MEDAPPEAKVDGDYERHAQGDTDEEDDAVDDTLLVDSPLPPPGIPEETLIQLLHCMMCTVACIMSPYTNVAKEDEPDSNLRDDLPAMRKQLDVLFARISEAEASLSATSSPEPLTTPPPHNMAAAFVTPPQTNMEPGTLSH